MSRSRLLAQDVIAGGELFGRDRKRRHPHTNGCVVNSSVPQVLLAELRRHVAAPVGRLYACGCGAGWKQMLEEITPVDVVAMVPRGAAPDLEDVFLHHVVRHVQWRILQVMETGVQFALKVLKDVVDDHQRGLETWDEGCAHPASIFNPSQCTCGDFPCRCVTVWYRSLQEGPVWAPTCGEDCAIDYGLCRCGWRSEYGLGAEFATDWAGHVVGVFIGELPNVPAQTRT